MRSQSWNYLQIKGLFLIVAEQYLQIPSEIFPRLNDEPDWYEETYSKWRSSPKPNLTYSDFYQIKSAVQSCHIFNRKQTRYSILD